MELKLERIGTPGALALGRKIVRDFHTYELLGYWYALREVWAHRAIVLGIRVDGRRCGYLVHGLSRRDRMARIMYLATEPEVRGRAWERRCSAGCAGITRTLSSTLRWRTRPSPPMGRSAG